MPLSSLLHHSPSNILQMIIIKRGLCIPCTYIESFEPFWIVYRIMPLRVYVQLPSLFASTMVPTFWWRFSTVSLRPFSEACPMFVSLCLPFVMMFLCAPVAAMSHNGCLKDCYRSGCSVSSLHFLRQSSTSLDNPARYFDLHRRSLAFPGPVVCNPRFPWPTLG